MKSFRLGSVRGIPIYLHLTAGIVALFFVLQLGLWGLPAAVLLFGSVLLHELGHAVVAQRYGIAIPRIDLHLLGGTASMASPPRTPREEILVAAAGPAVSFALAAAFGVLSVLFGFGLVGRGFGFVDLLGYGAILNLVLGVFNLVPALPMDGGRIFRAALSPRFGPVRSTEIAATVSRVFGGLFVAAALFWGAFSLGLIGLLLFFLAGQEERSARARGAYATGPRPGFLDRSAFVPPRWSHRRGAGAPAPEAPEIVVEAQETERYVDPWGRVWIRARRPR